MFENPNNYPWTEIFTQEYDAIKTELLSIVNKPLHPLLNQNTWTGERPNYLKSSYDENLAWKTYTFRFFGIDHVANCEACPVVSKLISTMPELVTVEFSMLEPDTHILPHRGYTDLVLRSHLGMIIPNGDVGIKVAAETKAWKEGEFLIFNDYAVHEAWNKTAERRVVLMIDFIPKQSELSPKEIARKIISKTTDSHILNLAPREEWLKWIDQGYFPTEPY
jgi:aspartyl/asparaginyl beta-hydroxylase (cupin superfamily)